MAWGSGIEKNVYMGTKNYASIGLAFSRIIFTHTFLLGSMNVRAQRYIRGTVKICG